MLDGNQTPSHISTFESLLPDPSQISVPHDPPADNLSQLPSDVGPEVAAQAVKVLETLSAHSDLKFTVKEHDFGGIAIDNHQDPLPESTLKACQEADAILLGNAQLFPFSFASLSLSRLTNSWGCVQALLEDLNGELILPFDPK